MTWPCLICNNPVETESDVFDCLQCFGCKKWLHPNCAKIGQKEYQEYCRSENKHWICSPCVQSEGKPKSEQDMKLDMLLDLIPLIHNIGSRMNDLEKHVNDLSGPKLEKKIEEVVDKKLAAALEEQKDIDSRKRNLIIVNLKESTKKDIKGKCEDDLLRVRNLVSEVVDSSTVHPEEIMEPVRFGDIPKKGEKPRVLRVSVRTEEMKSTIVKKMREKNRDIPFQERIYFNEDYTRKQREEYNGLKEELKRRTEAGEPNLGIRRGKVVTVKKKAIQSHASNKDENQEDDIDDNDDESLAEAAKELEARAAKANGKR